MKYEDKKKIETIKKCIQYGKYGYIQPLMNELILSGSEDAEIMKQIGMLYTLMGKNNLASVYMRKSFDLKKSVETLELLARINFEAGKYDQSAIQFEELIKHIPSNDIYQKCIRSYEHLDLYDEAIRIGKMFNYATDCISSYSDLIFMYISAGMKDEAIDTCRYMEQKYPNQALTNNIFGFLYECIYNDYDKAKEYFLKAAKQGFINAYYNLGVCCKQSEDFKNAEKYLKRLSSLNPEFPRDYNQSLGTVYLAERKMRLGYKYFKNRESYNHLIKFTGTKKNIWDGKDYPDETLYLLPEQAFGDSINFVRYIPMVAKKFKKVIFASQNELLELLKESFPKEKFPNIEIVSIDDIVKFNKVALLMDLPYLLNASFQNIPSVKSYLCANKRKTDMYKTNYFDNDNFKLGLCWRAKGMGLRDALYRTIDAPYYFKPFMELDNTSYYSFQMGDIFNMCEKYPQITDIANTINDFTDTAAALMNLDVLVTVDTALAHLAGALGVKTYLLLCHAPDWRWFDNTEKTEWYPSVTIIKQKDRKTWEDVSAKLTEYIKKDAKKYSKKK